MAAPIIIVGCGPAGLGFALAQGDHSVALESAEELSGLCRTVTFDGAVFDLGGHSFHTPHPDIRELVFSALPMYEQPRNAWCFVHGQWIPYPFQKHCEQLRDASVREQCQRGLETVGRARQARHFGDYVDQRFGAGVARHFLRPYNEKLWGGKLERMGVGWCGQRIASGGPDRFAATGGQRTPLQDGTQVAYPARRGFGEIFLALARRVPNIQLGEAVVSIDPVGRKVVTSKGNTYFWRHLVSTLPLPRLMRMLPNVPSQLVESVQALEALPMALVMVVVGYSVDTQIQRVYCAGPEIPAHKIVINHNSSPYLRSLPHHGILAEISNPASWSDGELTEQVLTGLELMGLIRSRAVVRCTKVVRLAAAYPVPTLERAAIVEQIKVWLAERNISTLGRFGEWDYINSDEALYRGLELGRRLPTMARAA